MLIVVTYHYVRPRFEHPFPGIQGMTPAALRAQLQLLAMVATFVSAAQLRDAVQGGAPLPERALLVTFDDGLREQVEHALPVLDQLGIPAVFFVNTAPIAEGTVSTPHKIHLVRAHMRPEEFKGLLLEQAQRQGIDATAPNPAAAAAAYPWDPPGIAQLKYFLNHAATPEVAEALVGPCFHEVFGDDERTISRGLYMDAAALRGLGERGYLGTHGDRHVSMGQLPAWSVQDDVRTSLDRCAQWTGARPFAFSYPYGSCEAATPQAGAAVAAAGVQLAFTSERAANVDLSRPFHLARFDCNDLPGGKQTRFGVESLFDSAPPARWYR